MQCTIVRNRKPNRASELPSARGQRFTQPFTNNYALHSIYFVKKNCNLQTVQDLLFKMGTIASASPPSRGVRRWHGRWGCWIRQHRWDRGILSLHTVTWRVVGRMDVGVYTSTHTLGQMPLVQSRTGASAIQVHCCYFS